MISSILTSPTYSQPPQQTQPSANEEGQAQAAEASSSNQTDSGSGTEPSTSQPASETPSETTTSSSTASQPVTTSPAPPSAAETIVVAQAAANANAEGAVDLSAVRREAEAARQSYLSQQLIDSVAAAKDVTTPLSGAIDAAKEAREAAAETNDKTVTAAAASGPAKSAAPANQNYEPRGMDMTV